VPLAAIALAIAIAATWLAGCGGHGPPYATSALDWATPNPSSSSGAYGGLSRYTAAELNRVHQGSRWGPITYVDAGVPSTRPDEVSVNPIDDYTWGAAAHSARDGRCYVIVITHDRTDPRYGSTHYGRLPAGATCVGSAATPATATSPSQPAEG
jgi:hypothetical protein